MSCAVISGYAVISSRCHGTPYAIRLEKDNFCLSQPPDVAFCPHIPDLVVRSFLAFSSTVGQHVLSFGHSFLLTRDGVHACLGRDKLSRVLSRRCACCVCCFGLYCVVPHSSAGWCQRKLTGWLAGHVSSACLGLTSYVSGLCQFTPDNTY